MDESKSDPVRVLGVLRRSFSELGKISLAVTLIPANIFAMFSHVVVFWTDPAKPEAADAIVAGAAKFLKPIPGLLHFQIGKMVGSQRPVVDQSYQVALNTVFTTKQAHDEYQVHPSHLAFVENYVKPLVKKVVVYDFE